MKINAILHKDAVCASNINLTGAKAGRLSLLAEMGIPVPEFYVVTTCAFKKYRSKSLFKLQKQLDSLTNFNPQNKYAVRSSAPFEDHASFSLAGQFETFLNVSGKENLVNAISDCWKSLDSSHVSTYLEQFGFSDKHAVMAVMLQQMINPDFAGVLFTRHPVTGDQDTFLLEIVQGYGEGLVSGEIDPVRISINRNGLAIKSVTGNTGLWKTLSQQTEFADQLKSLLELGLKIELILGANQDIEWAIENNKVWILQSRPVTNSVSRQRIRVDKEGGIWTDYFFAERFTKPLSPLGWSILQKWMENNAYRDPLKGLGYGKLATSENITRLFKGFPFTRISVFQSLYSVIPLNFISLDKQASLLLGHRNVWFRNSWRGFRYLFRLILTGDFNWIPGVNLIKWKQFSNLNKEKLPVLKAQLSQKDKLFSVFEEAEKLTDRFLSLHRWSITFADIFYALLKKCLQICKIKQIEETLTDLLTGFEENETIKANRAMLAIETDADIKTFHELYGHRSESLDIFQPVWKDMTDLLNKNNNAGEKFSTNRKDLLNRSNQAEQNCIQQINNQSLFIRPLLKGIFFLLLKYAREFTLLRENQRNEWHKILSVMRDVVIEYGNILYKADKLVHADDVFFMDRAELIQSFIDSTIPDEQIQSRKQAYQSLLEGSQAQPKSHEPHDFERLQGFGVSRGISRGRAFVARTLDQARQIGDDEILVAHSADPAWSPVFSYISGMVLETGGVLSHASIVAREFGLATVTGIASATQLIKNGDLIEINGETGTVEIIRN